MRGRFSFGFICTNRESPVFPAGRDAPSIMRSGDVGQVGVRAFLHPEPPINDGGYMAKDERGTFNLDFDLDFDLSDFDLIAKSMESIGHAPEAQQRILKPSIDPEEIQQFVMYENAEEFVEQIDYSGKARTYAWISGNFIFGDICEALISRRNVRIKKLYIASLSFSQENIDSLKNVMLLMGDELERLVLVLSGYQYSHEKFNLIPYMYEELDDGTDRFQVAFGAWHTKIITLETTLGNTITIHGSANLRSSRSIEQIMVEVNNKELHAFNAGIMESIARRFGTINYKAEKQRLRRIEGKQAWELSVAAAKGEI